MSTNVVLNFITWHQNYTNIDYLAILPSFTQRYNGRDCVTLPNL